MLAPVGTNLALISHSSYILSLVEHEKRCIAYQIEHTMELSSLLTIWYVTLD